MPAVPHLVQCDPSPVKPARLLPDLECPRGQRSRLEVATSLSEEKCARSAWQRARCGDRARRFLSTPTIIGRRRSFQAGRWIRPSQLVRRRAASPTPWSAAAERFFENGQCRPDHQPPHRAPSHPRWSCRIPFCLHQRTSGSSETKLAALTLTGPIRLDKLREHAWLVGRDNSRHSSLTVKGGGS